MQVAVLSDIHSNHIALETCLEYCFKHNITDFIFLGDYISDNPYPQKTMDKLYELNENYNCIFIKGNREDYFINYRDNNESHWKKGSSTGSLLYTHQNLRDKDITFFKSLSDTSVFKTEGYPSIRLCHGSLTNNRGHLKPNSEELKKTLSLLQEDYILCGHTHIALNHIAKHKHIINPGSVGVATKYSNHAEFVVMHGTNDKWTPEYIHLPFDFDALCQEHQTSGLEEMAPAWSKSVLHLINTEDDITDQLIAKVNELNNNQFKWEDIPEEIWNKALIEFKII